MIADDVVIEAGVRIHQPGLVNLYGCHIKAGASIGAFVEIGRGVTIGRNVKVLPFAFIPTGVTVGDDAFIGPGVIFTNDRHPRSTNEDGTLKDARDWTLENTIVERRASIGAGATILCGVRIGENAVVGAGAVVVRDVLLGTTVAGNPAHQLRHMTGRSGQQ